MTQADVLVISTIAGNSSLCLLLLWRGWSGRLQWLTVSAGISVILEFLFYFVHGFSHHLYAPLRVFALYWLDSIWFGLIAFEAWRAKVRWLEYLAGIQLAVGILILSAYLHGSKWAVYKMEIYNCWFNLGGILLCIVKFRGEPTYEPPDARS